MNRDATGLAGVRHIALRHARLDQCRGAGACARRRARAAVDHRATPERRPRPARQHLGLAAGQSLRHPAADRAVAAGAWRRNCRSSRRWRVHDAVAECAPQLGPALDAEMAERSAARRREARRHPDRRRERAGVRRRDRHRRQLRAVIRPTRRIRRPILRPPARRSTPERCSARLPPRCSARLAQWDARRGLRRASAPTGSRAPPARRADPGAAAGARTCRPLRGARRRRAGCCCDWPARRSRPITAGEVFALAPEPR